MSLKETDRGKRGRGVAGKKMSFWTIKKRRKSIYSDCSKLFKRSFNAYKT